MAKTKLQQLVEQYLAEHCEFDEHNACWFDEAYADYNDTIDADTAADILQSSDPEWRLEELMADWYVGTEWQIRDDHITEFKKTLKRQSWSDEDIEDMFVKRRRNRR